jgi:tRNA 2-(methylsulfanyl)-N6-isopentenyladenosine37 hydroxylase
VKGQHSLAFLVYRSIPIEFRLALFDTRNTMIQLCLATPTAWVELVISHFDDFLLDHAAAEKKASGMALSMLSHYPDRPELVKAMADLAIEELSHFRDVIRIIQKRGLRLGADQKDPYMHAVRGLMRGESEAYLLDRLLIGGVVEARGCERFALVGDALDDPALQRFYRGLANSEARHADLFVELAQCYFEPATVQHRLDELLSAEARIVSELPLRAALH